MKLCGKEKTKTRQDKRIVKLEQKIEIALFEHKVFSGYQHIHFLVHGHSSWSTFGLHLVRRAQKLCELSFSGIRPRKLDHQVGPWKKAIFHGTASCSMV